MITTQVAAKNIQIGDTIILEDGQAVEVTKISKGMPRNTIELSWKGGWHACTPSTLVARVNG